MRCLFAVSSWFVQRASLTVNIDLSDVTNRNYTVLYRTIVVYEKKNRSLVFSGSRKIPTLGSTVQWETRQASFPTGTDGPRVGIFLPPLNTNDGFYLSHISYAYLTWVAMWDRFFRQRATIGLTRSCMHWYVRKNYLTWVKTAEISICCARKTLACHTFFRGFFPLAKQNGR